MANLGNVEYDLEALKKHFVALGGSGSGKTVLGKVVIEEAAMAGISSILVDPQGDLASLALPVDDKFKTKVIIFTPTSSKGIPLSLNPLKIPPRDIEHEEMVSIFHNISSSIAKLLGYNPDKDKGKSAEAILYMLLLDSWQRNEEINTFEKLSCLVKDVPEQLKAEASSLANENELKELSKKIKFLSVGNKELLFQFGVSLDIDMMLKGDPKINVIYLNSLHSSDEKQFFVSMIASQLYEWMLMNPSDKLQGIFYIDEIADYIPAGSKKPLAKESLLLLFKQARKYGVGTIIATQNPGDIDYKAFAQFGTWALGRLTTKQDISKIKDPLKSIAGAKAAEAIDDLPTLQPGEFKLFCPDCFSDIQDVKVRKLYTEHKTLNEDDLKSAIPENIREEYKKHYVKKQACDLPHAPKEVDGKKHFEVAIDELKLSEIVDKRTRKKFVFFGAKDNIASKALEFRPMHCVKVKHIKKVLFKDKIEEHRLFFDAITGDLVQFKGANFKAYSDLKQFLELNESELAAMKHLIDNKKEQTAAEIALKLQWTDNFVNKLMNDLMKKKYVSYVGKAGRAYLWKPLINVKVPGKLASVESKDFDVVGEKHPGKELKPKVTLDQLQKMVKGWFNADIVESEMIYYPVYNISFSSKKEVNISAVNGKDFL